MAHNIHKRLDGTYQAMYVGYPAWHTLGEVKSEAQTARQVYRDLFRKRVVTTVPVRVQIGRKWVDVPEFRFTADEAEGQVFAPVSADYPVISDLTVLNLLEAIVRTSGRTVKTKAAIVAAFTLGNGARASATLDLTRMIGEKALQVIRDASPLEAFLVADWTHDATGAVKFMDAVNRVDCNNMLTAANISAENRGRLVRIRHAGSETTVEAQIEEAQRVLGLAEREIKTSVKFLSEIAKIALPKPDKWFADFTELLVPVPDPGEGGKRLANSRDEVRDVLRDLWTDSKTLANVPKSPYRAVQVVAEYGDHFRPLRVAQGNDRAAAERRFRSSIEGPAAEMKARAVDLIRQEFEIVAKPKALLVPAR